jgi:clan AA aspartic protease
MLIGQITAENQAVVPIEVHASEGQKAHIDATIDTGYNGFLTLPRALIDELDLPSAGPARAALGDGNEVRMELFLAAVRWEDGLQDVLVLAAEGGVLLGMAMLLGCRLTMDVEADGTVSIESLTEVHAVN